MAKNNFFKYILAISGTFALCFGLLFLVCFIPQQAIYEGSKKSAEYFRENEAFPLAFGDMMNSRMDNYADSELLNVIYNMDEENRLKSIIGNPYYRIDGNAAADNFMASVNGEKPNNEYSRYWHGSAVLVRPLLVFTSIEGVRGVLFGLLLMLNGVLTVLLLKRKMIKPMILYLVALVLVQVWMTAFSLEYIMTFLVMTALTIGMVMVKDDETKVTCLFLAGGILTAFMDFLTAETLSFTIPYLMLVLCRKEEGSIKSLKEEFLSFVKFGCCFLGAYALMFAIKWGLVYGVIGNTAFKNAMDSAAIRIDGMVTTDGTAEGTVISSGARTFLGLVRNLACLFPFGSNISVMTVTIATIVLFFLLVGAFYMLRKQKVDFCFVCMTVLVAIVPYARYIVLSSHSYIHYFFTYRAQMAMILGVMAIFAYEVEPAYIGLGKGKKNKTKVKKKKR